MTGTWEFIVVMCILMSASHCESAHLPPPSKLTARWIDPLTLNVSWTWHRPKGLPQDCEIMFEYRLQEKNLSKRTPWTNFLENLLTEESDTWTYIIHTTSCKNQKSSSAKIIVKTPKPNAEVKDFKCYLSNSDMNCSWIPNPVSPMSLSYRMCGSTQVQNGFQECDLAFSSGQRRVCHMKGQFLQKDLCMVATTAWGRSTFKPKFAVRPPKMNITEEGSNLILTLTPLEVNTDCWLYNICYSVCNNPAICLEYSMGKEFLKVAYEKSCRYEFQYRAQTNDYCSEIKSDWSEIVTYGSTDWTLTVLAIVIPLIVSACIILSCYCFRRHKDIICPDIPDPSTIFKEMMNGNKELKTKMPTYTPVQEPIECITVIPSIPQNS